MPRNYRSLKRAAIRPDWNKYTLFNLSRLQAPRFNRLTFFQQKWKAKSDLRAYHSPYVREGYWERLFDRRLPGVVSMNYRYLATHDGSELAAGRGSGLTSEEDGIIKEEQGQTGTTKLARTPYMAMAFFPLERRLDTAIWRALFASSTRQARMLVAHGAVQVNGRKMIHPGYLLNPGDMFTVEKEKVMFATGARKRSKISTKPWDRREMSKSHPLTEDTTQTSGEQRIRARQAEKEAARLETLEESKENTKAEDGDMKDNEVKATSEKSPVDVDPAKEARSELKKLRDVTEEILQIGKKELSGKRLQALRAFTSDVNKSLSRASHRDVSITESLNEMDGLTKVFNELYETLPTTVLPAKDRAKKKEEFMTELAVQKETTRMIAALEKARENPIDSTLPYASPWTPRPYMSAFAFIPRYLEVNQNICSAVYLRHPVARPGLAEVPTPFHYETSQLGFNWYLRRR